MEQIEMKLISGDVAAVRILPEVKVQIKDQVKIFNSITSLPDAIQYLIQAYAEEDYDLKQFSIKIVRDSKGVISIATSTLSRLGED